PDDRGLLSDPARGIPLAAKQQFLGGMTFSEPDDVRELADGEVITMAGLDFTVAHVPGHTEGSVTFGTEAAAELAVGTLCSGDLLFAGSIGRTFLAGGAPS